MLVVLGFDVEVLEELRQLGGAVLVERRYDANGNMTADSFTAASFNQLDQMTSYTSAGGSAFVLAYNGLGQARRTRAGSTNFINSQLGIQSTSAGTPSHYTHDPDGNLVSLRNPGGGNGGSYYPLTDALGSTVAVTDSSGTVVDAFKYTLYGADAGSTAPVVDPFRFAGGYYGTTMKLYKFGERYCDPSTGRWTQNDPISDPADLHGWNNYDYSANDPINNLDPSGMCICLIRRAKHAAHAAYHHVIKPAVCAVKRHSRLGPDCGASLAEWVFLADLSQILRGASAQGRRDFAARNRRSIAGGVVVTAIALSLAAARGC